MERLSIRHRKGKSISILKRIKHVYYRVYHYSAAIRNGIGEWWDRFWGGFSYQRSPMYRSDMDYRTFHKEHGRYGEFQLWRKAKRYVGRDARWLTNVYLPKADGTTCEIDLIAVCKRGVLVFESKNYIGWIYGDEKRPYWYQMIRKDLKKQAKKYSFFNPIMQNGMHCRIIREFTKLSSDKVHSVIVFGDRCRLKEVRYSKEKTALCRRGRLGSQMRRFDRTVLSKEEIEQLYEKLKPFVSVSLREKATHIQNVLEKK